MSRKLFVIIFVVTVMITAYFVCGSEFGFLEPHAKCPTFEDWSND